MVNVMDKLLSLKQLQIIQKLYPEMRYALQSASNITTTDTSEEGNKEKSKNLLSYPKND